MSHDIDLISQIGAGADGVAFRASERGSEVEVRALAAAWRDPVRRDAVSRRLKHVRLLQHPGTRRIRRLDFVADPPFVVVDPPSGPPLDEHLAARLPLPPVEAIAVALDLAAVLREAHRLGLGHGRLSPTAIRVGVSVPVQLDFTNLAIAPDDTPMSLSEPDAIAADVAALGGLMVWLMSGKTFDPRSVPALLPGPVRVFLSEVSQCDPAERPGIDEFETRLRQLLRTLQQEAGVEQTNPAEDPAAVSPVEPPHRERLGRFRLIEKLGQGGMGEVWRAADLSDGRIVAIKTLLPEFARRPDAILRFRKEARLLREANNPFVTNLLEINEDDGIHFIAVEFVAGRSVAKQLESGKPLQENFAIAVMADVCRALVDAHARGIIHRDIKPDNILLMHDPDVPDVVRTPSSEGEQAVAKLSDFGLARHVVESESLHMTRTGAVVGTPLYLSPEQCKGEPLDPRSDVYGIGATLFHLLAGRPPFVGDNPLVLINHHCNSPIPDLRALDSSLSEGIAQVVLKCLAKAPAHRHADAGELLRDLMRVQRGEPATVAAHPLRPACDPAKVLEFDFRWDLDADPLELWPLVSNTERLNRAIHLPAVQFTTKPGEGGTKRTGKVRKAGIDITWEEHPFEWIEGRRFGVLREFASGPFRWLLSVVELEPRAGGGTTLHHRLRIEPSGFLGRTFANLEIGMRTRRAMDRVYRRIDAAVKSKSPADPFEEAVRLNRSQERHLDSALDRLLGRGLNPSVVERLGAYLAAAPAQEVARIRPIALARRLGVDTDTVISACLHGAREGLLDTFWDLLCPICRIPSQITDTLKALKEHGHCEACNIDYDLDFGRSVELIFRADPSIRDSELGTFCIGGPAHSPHVVAQVRVAGGERIELELALGEGAYKLRGPQLPTATDLRIQAEARLARWEADLHRLPRTAILLRPGGQVVALTNPGAQELVVRLERSADRDDALTAARAASLALFRELFPGEVLSAGQLVSVSTVTLLASELLVPNELGESEAFGQLHAHLRQVEGLARKHGGALVKAAGDGALAAFHEPAAAVRTMLELSADDTRLSLHRGPALAVTINETLDYFGATVRTLQKLLEATPPGERHVTQAVMDDPAVMAALLAASATSGVVTDGEQVVHRIEARTRSGNHRE